MAPLAAEPAAIIAQTGEQINPALAFNPTAQNFLVVWEDASTSKPSIWGRMVDVHGTPLYGAFPISSDTTYGRHKPDVVYNVNNNEFLVVWEDGRNAGNGMDIYGAVVSVSKNFLPILYR